MAFRRRSIIALQFFFLLCVTVYGQTQETIEPIPEFRVIALDDLPMLFYDVDGEKEIINVGMSTLSTLLPAPPDRRLRFYREEPNPDPLLPPLKVTIAEAKLPSKTGPFLVVLVKSKTSSTYEYETLVVDQSLDAHPEDTYRVFNFSKRRLAVRLADKDMVLDRGHSEIVPYPDTRKTRLKIAAADDQNGWLLVKSSSHVVGSNARTIILIVDIPPSERDPDPKGVIARQMRERIVTDEFGVKHVQ